MERMLVSSLTSKSFQNHESTENEKNIRYKLLVYYCYVLFISLEYIVYYYICTFKHPSLEQKFL